MEVVETPDPVMMPLISYGDNSDCVDVFVPVVVARMVVLVVTVIVKVLVLVEGLFH